MNKKNLSKKIIIILFLFSVFFVRIPALEASEDFNFSLEITDNDLNLFAGENVTTCVFINQTSDSTDLVNIEGKWINDEKPSGISVNISNNSGIPSFVSSVEFISTSDAEIGAFIYNLTAERNNVLYSVNIEICITNVSINISTDKESYEHYQTINVFGDITTSDGNIFSDDIVIDFEFVNGDWKRTVSTSVDNNSFEYQYNISFGDPPSGGTESSEGKWKITAKITDENNETSKVSKNVEVSIPPDIVIYKTTWTSPAEGTVYTRGDIFTISIDATRGKKNNDAEEGIPIENASTRCILPNLEVINLTEKNPGYYYNTYRIPYDSSTGTWFLSADCIKNNSGTFNSGGSYTYIIVEPVMLNMTLIEPDSNEFYEGDTFEIKVKLSYPDGTPVEDATVNATFPSQNLTLQYLKEGTYGTNYTVENKDIGNWFINITSLDENGNYGSVQESIFVYKPVSSSKKEKADLPLMTIFIVLLACIVSIFVLKFVQKRFSKQHYEDVQTEIKEIQKLQKEAVEKYYKKGTINRPTYDNLRHEYESRLDELKNEESKIKK